MTLSSDGNIPEVSVLMSCFNSSPWIHEAVESVLGQTFTNFEFILVDDGSTDETLDIIRDFRNKDQRISVLAKPHTGLTDSLNVGLAHARARCIARLDADDLCEPGRLEQQVKFMHEYPEVVLLGTGFLEINEQSQIVKKHVYPSGHRNLTRHLERLQRFFPHSSAMFRREIVQQVGGYNPLFRKSQDWDLWLRLAERGKVACLDQPLVRVRKHAKQISGSSVGISQITYGTVASVCHFLRIQGYPDPSTREKGTAWQELTIWVTDRIREEGLIERWNLLGDARNEFFSTKYGWLSTLWLVKRLVESGQAWPLVREWFIGSSLPHRFAREWRLTGPA